MTQTDPATPPPQPAPITEADIWAKICAKASKMLDRPDDKPLQFGRFALGHLYVFWRAEPAPDGSVAARGVTVYERGKPAPIKASLGIMALFGFADDFVRVYAIPIDPNGGDFGPARITLSRTAPVPSAFVEYIPMDQFITEIASEVVNDLEGPPDDGDEEEDDDDDDDDDDPDSVDTGGFTPT